MSPGYRFFETLSSLSFLFFFPPALSPDQYYLPSKPPFRRNSSGLLYSRVHVCLPAQNRKKHKQDNISLFCAGRHTCTSLYNKNHNLRKYLKTESSSKNSKEEAKNEVLDENTETNLKKLRINTPEYSELISLWTSTNKTRD